MRFTSLPLTAVTVLSLSGCAADGVSTTRSEGTNASAAAYVPTSAANGTNSVQVLNSPIAADAVLDAVRDRYRGNQYRFAFGAPLDWNGYTVVIGFGRPAVGNQNLCQAPALPPQPARADVMELKADYCYGDRMITEVTGRAPAADAVAVHNLIGQAVAELLAYQPPHYGHRSLSR